MNPIRAFRGWQAARRHRAELRSLVQGGGFAPAAPVLSGTYVTPETAIAEAAVYAAVNVISRDLATMPKGVYRKLDGGGREVAEEHPAHELIHTTPDGERDAWRFWQAAMGHVLTRGNGYAEIERDPGDGAPVAIHLLHPTKTLPKRTKSGTLYYQLDGDDRQRLAPEDCLHLAGLGFDGLAGFSPVTVCRQTIGLSLATTQFGASFFGNGAIMRGILKYPRKLSQAAKDNLRRSFNAVHQGSQAAHQVGILEEGLEWQQTQLAPEDGQFLQTRQFQVLDIARIFSVPPHKIGDYSQAHLSSVEEANLDYIATTLLGWLVMIEAECNSKLLTRDDRRRYEIAAELGALLRGNMAARLAWSQGMRNMGAASADEIRRREGLNPIGRAKGGDLYLVQGQYIPLDQVGKQPAAPPPMGKAGAKSRRFNPNHGKDGKFGGGHDGGGGGGDDAPAADFAGKPAAESKAYWDGMSGGWRDGLSSDERKSLKAYSSDDYKGINDRLRGQPGIDPDASRHRAIAADVDAALSRASLKEPTVVYRGVMHPQEFGLDPATAVGKTIRDPAYMSTSLSRRLVVDRGFAGEGGAVLRITAPAGSRGASLAGVSRYAREREVLFARGSAVKITAVEKYGERTLYHAELMQ